VIKKIIEESNMTFCSEVDAGGLFIRLDELSAESLGLPKSVNELTGLSVYDIPNGDAVVDTVVQENKQILLTGEPKSCLVWTKNNEDEWLFWRSHRARSETGTVLNTSVIVSSKLLFGYWISRLDYVNKKLFMPDEGTISARDMAILRCRIQGWPMQLIADCLFVSKKTVEKRMTYLRHRFSTDEETFEMWMYSKGLTSFLLGCPDWFSEKSIYQSL
jgi:hypothetical protein